MLEKTSWKAPFGVLESLNDFNSKYGKALIKALIKDGNKSIEQVIEEFTMKKADVDYINKDGKSALFWACHKNQEEIVELLLNAKDPDFHFGIYYSLFEWFNPLYLKDKNTNFQTRLVIQSHC